MVINSPLVDKSAKAVHKSKFVSSPIAEWTGGSVGITVGGSVIEDSVIGGSISIRVH